MDNEQQQEADTRLAYLEAWNVHHDDGGELGGGAYIPGCAECFCVFVLGVDSQDVIRYELSPGQLSTGHDCPCHDLVDEHGIGNTARVDSFIHRDYRRS